MESARTSRPAGNLADHLKWIKFSGASWTKDNQGFFYSRYDEPLPGTALKEANYYQKLYYHRLGTPQSEDRLVYHRPDQKEWSFAGQVTDDGRYLVISIAQGTDPKNRVYYQDLTQPNSPVTELLNQYDAAYDFIDNDGSTFLVSHRPQRAAETADRHRCHPTGPQSLAGINTPNERHLVERSHPESAIPGSLPPRRPQPGADLDTTGRWVRDLALPGLGTGSGFAGQRSEVETFYAFTSYTVSRHDLSI